MRGAALGWAYNGAFNYSRSDVDQQSTNGYARESALIPILNSGVVNPFGPNTPAIVDLMSMSKFEGTLRTGTATTTSLDLIASNDVLALAPGPLSVALGLSARREEVAQTSSPALESGDILNLSATPSLSGARDILALFAEANVPLATTLQGNVAARYDRYSDFGGTTNPQVSLRWQPTPTLLLRGSAGTGYFAPSLPALVQPPVYRHHARQSERPGPLPGYAIAAGLQNAIPAASGWQSGAAADHLQAVECRWRLGADTELSLGLDYVSILLDDRVNFFPVQQIFAQCPNGVTGPTCYLIHRGPADPAYPTLPGPIVQVDQFLTNLGKQKMTAIDFNVQFKAPRQTGVSSS